MSHILARTDGPADAELITAVRAGDLDAYGELFSRHVDAARRLAGQLAPGGDADDLVSEAFSRVLGVLQRGGGPDVSFRAYLLTAVRRLHVDLLRASGRVQPTEDLTGLDPGIPFEDTVVAGFESTAAARAFASLPERWQMVLWHTEVEGQKPAEVAPLLGITPNSVSALAYRAREGLRQAFLTEHAQALESDACRWTHGQLGGYVRGGISRRDGARVEAHLQECRPCAAVYLELTEVNTGLAGLIAPLLLAGSAPAYLAAAGTGVGKGGLLLLVGRGREWAGTHVAGALAGVSAGVVVVASGVLLLTLDRPLPAGPVAAGPATSPSAEASSAPPEVRPGVGRLDGRRPAGRATDPVGRPAGAAAAVPGDVAPATGPLGPRALPTRSPRPAPTQAARAPRAPSPATGPVAGPTAGPTEGPAEGPSEDPADEPTGPSGEPGTELAVRVEQRSARRQLVTVAVTGLGGPARLTATGSDLAFLHSYGPCVDEGTSSRCLLGADSEVRFHVEAEETGGSLALRLLDGSGTPVERVVVLPGGRRRPAG